jgi:hypothetical protein
MFRRNWCVWAIGIIGCHVGAMQAIAGMGSSKADNCQQGRAGALTPQDQLVVWAPCPSRCMAIHLAGWNKVAVCIGPYSCLRRSRGRRDQMFYSNILSRSGNELEASQISLGRLSARCLRGA